jgi:glycosyltransferase involved in cell wall biosynthesis
VRVYLNFTEQRGPYGGANSFLRTLSKALRGAGVTVTHDVAERVDVALLNALTNGIDLEFVRGLAERGTPIVHRKVGYRVSGSPEMRAVTEGVVHGDALQVAFTPYLAHTIFQSEYSRGVFVASGFDGPATVIHNGVDEDVFNLRERRLFGSRERRFWDGREPLRVVISTWSDDENKGFADYRAIDAALGSPEDVQLTLVGRVPAGTEFAHIRHVGPRGVGALARFLKRQHVLLQLARYETCSNALLEGMNCGLPPVYLDSGSNAELADGYGVRYEGDFDAAVDAARAGYFEFVERLRTNPYRISQVLPRYLRVLEAAAA